MRQIKILLAATRGDADPDNAVMKFAKESESKEHVAMTTGIAHDITQSIALNVECLLMNTRIPISDKQAAEYRKLVRKLTDMDDKERCVYVAEELKKLKCRYDEDGNALTTENENYLYSKVENQAKEHEKFSTEDLLVGPFMLLDGSKAYSAKKGDIDWEQMHLNHYDVHKRLWNVCVDGDEPQTDQERRWVEQMAFHTDYFARFYDADDYATRSTAFFCHFFIDAQDSEKVKAYSFNRANEDKWPYDFYEKFIEPLDNDTKLTLYIVTTE
jgi:hypothetical protein